jgi:hypothetical protein
MFIFSAQAKPCYFHLPDGIPRMIMLSGCAAARGDFMKKKCFLWLYRWVLFFTIISNLAVVYAQDLDPRAYIRIPIKTTTLISGIAYSYGGVVSDPTLPVKNIKADVQSISLGVAHSFKLGGMTAQALVALPYSWAQVSGEINEQARSITRSGLADTRLRFSVLFKGAPPLRVEEFVKAPANKTLLGASINIVAPTGQFFSDKLINLGTNRWAFRPELALSQPVGKRWLLDVYGGLWLFTANKNFFPGSSLRTQDPMGTLQAHFSYNFKPNLWIALTTTYYVGGTSTINGEVNDDRQSNVRMGLTCVLPTGKFSSLKLATSGGAIVRVGQDFTTLSLGWQRTWIKFAKPPVKKV